MTVKQQKIGLLSSSSEESALAVSLQRYHITSNAPLWLAATVDGRCMHYQPSVSPDTLSSGSKFLTVFFSLQPVKYLNTGSGVLSVTLIPVQVEHTCKLTLIHEAKVLSGILG